MTLVFPQHTISDGLLDLATGEGLPRYVHKADGMNQLAAIEGAAYEGKVEVEIEKAQILGSQLSSIVDQLAKVQSSDPVPEIKVADDLIVFRELAEQGPSIKLVLCFMNALIGLFDKSTNKSSDIFHSSIDVSPDYYNVSNVTTLGKLITAKLLDWTRDAGRLIQDLRAMSLDAGSDLDTYKVNLINWLQTLHQALIQFATANNIFGVSSEIVGILSKRYQIKGIIESEGRPNVLVTLCSPTKSGELLTTYVKSENCEGCGDTEWAQIASNGDEIQAIITNGFVSKA